MSVIVTQDRVADLLRTIQQMGMGGDVLVGIPSDRDDRSGEPIGNASIGYIQEKGSAAQGIPPRPFLEPGVANVADKCAEAIRKGAVTALTDFNPNAVMIGKNKAGLIAQNSVKAAITAGDGFAPLSKATLAARKRRGVSRTKPLIDTGSLRNSITYVIRKGES